MKKILFTTFFAFFAIFAQGQERINKKNVEFQNSIGTLKEATGWSYNDSSGDWIDYPNLIEDDPEYKDSSILDFIKSYSEQNFINLEFKSLIYNGSNYYILLITKWTGAYEYPTIKEDWYRYKIVEGLVFTEEQFNKLKTLSDKAVLKTKIYTSIHFDADYTEDKMLDNLQFVIENQSDYGTPYTFPLMVSTKGKIRFFIPEKKLSYSRPFDFEDEYFEIEKEAFNKLIGI